MGALQNGFWWTMEVGLVAAGVLAGVSVLLLAALLLVLGAPHETTMRAFLAGLLLWAGGIGWGMFINQGARWLVRG